MKPVPWLSVCLALGTVTLGWSAETSAPLPGLPPEPRPLQIKSITAPTASTTKPTAETTAAQRTLGEDIANLKRTVQRVRETLANDQKTTHATTTTAAPGHGNTTDPDAPRTATGPRRGSPRFGIERLSAQTFSDGSITITAALEREPVQAVCQELASLLGRTLDDSELGAGRRPVSLRLKDVPWDEALDRTLGQVGLGWRETGHDRSATIVVFDTTLRPRDSEQVSLLANRALTQAARDHASPAAAEALYLIAQNEAEAGRHLEAMRLFSGLADEFSANKDPTVIVWVARAMRGVGDALMALSQFQDARGIYLNYIAHANEHDPALPEVHLAAAEASRRHSRAKQDAVAFDEAIDTLHNLLERFADQPDAATTVHAARQTLGELLFGAERWREAETQLKLVAAASGGANDQIAFWLAECAFRDSRLDEALPTYDRLYRAWKSGKAGAQTPESIAVTSAYRLGQCHLQRKEPRYVHALFAFLRARQDFPRSDLDAEMLISIARCYAELERDDDTVNALWELLKGDAINDSRPGRLQLDQLLGELEARLGEYAGPVRAKALFYIAQADYRRAQRDRGARSAAANDAVHHYERVIAEQPPKDLLHAARLGLARAAFLGGNDLLGVQTLQQELRDPTLSIRDRDYAANLLGNHLRDKGQLREAIKAFRGEVD